MIGGMFGREVGGTGSEPSGRRPIAIPLRPMADRTMVVVELQAMGDRQRVVRHDRTHICSGIGVAGELGKPEPEPYTAGDHTGSEDPGPASNPCDQGYQGHKE